MNWNKNLEDYPNTLDLFDKFMYNNRVVPSKRRYLFDFFDTYNLFVEIHKEVSKCRYVINGQNIIMYGKCIYDCRKDAEDAAFTRCFEIMEKRLQ